MKRINSDKILVISALVITLTAFLFRESLVEDARFYFGSEGKEVLEHPIHLFTYLPLSQHERKEMLSEHIRDAKALQKRISKTIFIKHFIDLSGYILAKEHTLAQDDIESIFGGDWLSLQSVKNKTVIGSPEISRDSLVEFASVIDEVYDQEGNDIYIVSVNENSDIVTIRMLNYLPHLLEPHRDYFIETEPNHAKMLDILTREKIFGTKTLSLRATIPDATYEEILEWLANGQFNLTGELSEMDCPGPPEFNNIEISSEHVFILKLKRPLVFAIHGYERTIEELQLYFTDSPPTDNEKEAEILFTGILYPATTPHHQTEFVMEVTNWRVPQPLDKFENSTNN